MARESKRARDERRFGKAELLADQVFSSLGGVKVIEASNVSEYYHGYMKERTYLDLMDDIHSVRLPFSAAFIEMLHRPFPFRTGWLFQEIDPRGEDSVYAARRFDPGVSWDYAFGGNLYVGCGSLMREPAVACVCHADRSGRLVANPGIQFDGRWERVGAGTKAGALHLAMETLVPTLLAVAFMNCRNVVQVEHEPDRRINRERRKGGLEPFIRYHTINIEPMKRVLKSEGNIESEGLKRALHICRGHFATYSDDKPLFGRKGAAGTFWVPAHVRGSSDRGVVFSDYKVNPPGKTG